MANVAKTAVASAAGVNQTNIRWFRLGLGADTLANADTLTVTLPGMAGQTFIPMVVQAGTFGAGDAGARTWTRDADIGAFTTYNELTGVLVITATGAVAASTEVVILMVGNQ